MTNEERSNKRIAHKGSFESEAQVLTRKPAGLGSCYYRIPTLLSPPLLFFHNVHPDRLLIDISWKEIITHLKDKYIYIYIHNLQDSE